MCQRRYRDTNMEIQGLPDAQNIHSHHGVLLDRSPSHPPPDAWSTPRLLSHENETTTSLRQRLPSGSDANNNSRPPQPRLLLGKDGSESSSSCDGRPSHDDDVMSGDLGDLTTSEADTGQLFGLYEFTMPVMRSDAVLLPVEGEATSGDSKNCDTASKTDRNSEGVYVVLNVFKEDFDGTMKENDVSAAKIDIVRQVSGDKCCATMDAKINADDLIDVEMRPMDPIFQPAEQAQGHTVEEDGTTRMCVITKDDAEEAGLPEASQLLLQNMETPDIQIQDLAGSDPLADDSSFSGTVTINDQSITVNIENGILSLGAPLGVYVQHKEVLKTDGDVGFGHMSGAKKMSVTSPNHHHDDDDENIMDSSLSPLGEDEQTKFALTACDDAKTLFRSKKDAPTSFTCPSCSLAFDARQKLKVHLLTHADDPRPYQCEVEGCGWTFTTSYKLKRHLLSHDKQRPHTCQFEGCGRCFSTVYNLKAHFKVHVQDHCFVCDVCSEKFRSATRLANHQRIHFEPQRPYKCEFTGCERSFITFSALFSHKRTHFKEMGDFTCTYPGCSKTYDKACRLKLHLRSHTGERPFKCDSAGCGWSFTSMSKLLRHKRKHNDDRRFVCKEEGCGKSFTRAEHLKGHSITHLGTKPFQCHTEGCSAKFSARSSLYIHSKKHKQDASSLKTPCPVSSCTKHFSSRSSLKSHMLKHHNMTSDALVQMETMSTLTPSNELIPSSQAPASTSCIAKADQFTNLDLSSLFSNIPGGTSAPAGMGLGIPVNSSASKNFYKMDLSMAGSGIITIDPSTVGSALGSVNGSGTKAVESLALSSSSNLGAHHRALEGGDILLTQDTLNLDDVQMITSLGTLTALTIQASTSSADSSMSKPGSSSAICVEAPGTLAVTPVSELLTQTSKVVDMGCQGGSGHLLSSVEPRSPLQGAKIHMQYVVPTQGGSCSLQAESEIKSQSPFLESGGSARTDYRAIQLAKKNKQNGTPTSNGRASQRKAKGVKAASLRERVSASSVGLTLREPVSGTQFVQIQLLQDDPTPDGDLAFQLTSQPSSSHSQLTTDLPVHILQEPTVITEENSLDNLQFTGSTINLQDLE